MPYFHISSGLRGCYMPDNAWVAKFDTRRALIAHCLAEAMDMREAYGHGYSKAAIKSVLSHVWAETRPGQKKSFYDHVIGFGRTRSKSDRPFGLFISHATRADYLACQKENQ